MKAEFAELEDLNILILGETGVQCVQVHFNMTRTVCVDLNTLTFKILNETTFQKCFPGL